jgi:hypothetical protein
VTEASTTSATAANSALRPTIVVPPVASAMVAESRGRSPAKVA